MLLAQVWSSWSLSWITPFGAVRVILALIAFALLTRNIWVTATSQREFLPLAGVLSALWWTLASRGNLECEGKFIAASLAALAIGTLCGFVFSSTTGEGESVGKVRDWLVGGIAALSVAQVASGGNGIRKVLGIFVPVDCPDDLAVVAGMAVVYSVGGFFLMFFNRELILNILLTQQRNLVKAEFDKSSKAADKKIVDAVGLTPGVLDWQTSQQEDGAALDPQVLKYVTEVGTRLRQGEHVPVDEVKKAAVVLGLGGEIVRATQFLELALQTNPADEDLAMMLAKSLAELDKREEAVAELVEFKTKNAKPSRVDKLLGFYLLWSKDRLQESIEHTTSYLDKIAPKDDGAIFNLACAYAQLYAQTQSEENRKLALQKLKDAISMNHVWKERAVELTGIDGDFVSLKDDAEFKVIVQK